MPASDKSLRQGVGAFLRQLLDDASRGQLRSLNEYQARFPNAHDQVADLYADLRNGGVPDSEVPAPPARASASTTGNPGERVLGDFRLLREIGRGGMGVVHEAEQISLGRTVAVKILSSSLALDPQARARFERESRLAAQLDHPGIAKVLAADVADDVLYFAMELIDGASLDKVLLSNHATPVERMTGRQLQESVVKCATARRPSRSLHGLPVTPTETESTHWRPGHIDSVAGIGVQVASALHHAHQQGVVHRDVKPANILVRPNGSAVLTDFGLARSKSTSALTVTGDFLGTPFYVSPEQITAGHVPIDHRTDVFSLGVTLYEMLTHRRPFESDVAIELKARILTKEPPRLQRFNRHVPHDLGCIVIKALEKDPDRRYATAQAFADDLRAFLAGRTVAARPVSAWTRTARWTRRNPLPAAFVVLLTVGLATVAGLLVVTLRAREDRERLAVAGRALALLRQESTLFPPWPDNAGRLISLEREAMALVNESATQRRVAESLPTADDPLADMLQRSVQDLETIERHALPSLRARLRWAQTLRQRSITDPQEQWARAIAEIARHVRYRGLRLVPQMGLIPLGPDPASGLWEFAEIASGEVPQRDAANKLLSITPKTGMVFVLIPPGEFLMGAQREDPTAPGFDAEAMTFDGPPRRVGVSAFFLAKYELTYGQWENLSAMETLAGRWHKPIAELEAAEPALPLHDVSWTACTRILEVHGCCLPTEAQWEYACRADTETPWWTGAEAISIEGAANVADASCGHDRFGIGDQAYAPFSDGHIEIAPIPGRRANPFGLHDMHGNVAEWCRDWFGGEPYVAAPRSGDGLVERDRPADGTRAIRGGAFSSSITDVRSARRNGLAEGGQLLAVGVRACRSVFPMRSEDAR